MLIGLLALTIVLFGIDATDGPLQVALLASAVFAGLVALKNGYTSVALREAAVGGVSSAMGAIFILLAVGALIGTWNMAGHHPDGRVLRHRHRCEPAIFYAAVAVICALVGMVTGSSWTTAGTLGVAFVGMAPMLGPVDDDRRRARSSPAPTSATRCRRCRRRRSWSRRLVGGGHRQRAHQGHGRGPSCPRSSWRSSIFLVHRLVDRSGRRRRSAASTRRATSGIADVQHLADQPAAARRC